MKVCVAWVCSVACMCNLHVYLCVVYVYDVVWCGYLCICGVCGIVACVSVSMCDVCGAACACVCVWYVCLYVVSVCVYSFCGVYGVICVFTCRASV